MKSIQRPASTSPRSRFSFATLLALLVTPAFAWGLDVPVYDHHVDGVDLYLVADTEISRPVVPVATEFDGVNNASINNRGQVLFSGYFGSSSGEFLAERGKPLNRIIAVGDVVPGTPQPVDWVPDRSINDSGKVLATIAPDPGFDPPGPGYEQGIWRFDGTSWGTPLATVPGPAIGVGPGGTYIDFLVATPHTTQSGHVLIKGYVDAEYLGFGSEAGIWVADPNDNLRFVIRGGMEVPTNAGPAVIYGEPFIGSRLDNNGRAMFMSEIEGANIDQSNNHGVWTSLPNGDLQLIAQRGQVAPGTEPNTVFDFFEIVEIDSNGNTLLYASLDGPNVDSSNRNGLWMHREDGQLEKLLRSGDVFPGSTDLYLRSVGLGSLSESGTVVTLARFEDNLGQAAGFSLLSIDQNGNTMPIVDSSMDVPGGTTGASFRNIANTTVNRFDQVAFEASLAGPGITTANDGGVWATDRQGNLVPILREGDEVWFSDTDVRTIQSIGINLGFETSRASGFNDRGELVMEARFTDGSRSILVSYAAVPEPSACLIAMVGVAAAGIGRYRRRRA